MPVGPLPDHPSFEHLRKQARRLLVAARAGDAGALRQIEELHPRAAGAARLSLADAQFVTARSYGFASWARLKQHLAAIQRFVWNPPPVPEPPSSADAFARLACLTYAGWHRSNPGKAERMLADEPGLASRDVYCAAAAGNVAAVQDAVDRDASLVSASGGPLRWPLLLYACYSRLDPVDARHSTLEVARLLLTRGADPNAGVLFSGSYAFTALTGAFGRGEDWHNQPPHPEWEALATLLLDAGADPNDAQTLYNRHFQPDDRHLILLLRYGLGEEKGGPWLERLNDRRFTPARLLTEELWSAARNHFSGRVKLLVSHGVDVTVPGLRTGRTPYEEAVMAGSLEIAEYLAQHGAARVVPDPLESFVIACIAGRRDEVRERLDRDPSLFQRLGRSRQIEALHRAVGAKQREGVRLLVELGADVNGMIPGTGYDRGVLHDAAGWGGLEMVRLLLSLGADPDLRDLTYGSTPVGWAYHNTQPDVVEYLLARANIFDAVRCDGVERADLLLRRTPSLREARDEAGEPLIFYLHAQLQRLDEMLTVLVAHGVDVNAIGSKGRTLLDVAVAGGLLDFADVLRRHGARPAWLIEPL